MGYFELTGRSAMVTGAGAGGGIGAAVAAALAEAGAAVLVTDIDGDAAAAVAQRIRSDGGKADSCALDVGDRAAADAAAAQAAGLGGGALHILVNNAGVTSPAMFPKLTDETFRLTFDVHVMGTFHCTQAALPFIPTDGTGRVINVTSAAGLTGTLGQVNYSAAKAGHHRLHQIARARTRLQEHHGECPCAACCHTDDRDHPHQREVRRQHDAAHPVEALGGARGGRGCVRVHGVGRGVLHHRTGFAGGRRHGDLTSSGG